MKPTLTLLAVFVMLTLNALAGKTGWDDNYDKALAEAKAHNKLVLLDFTGSDWCGYCMQLDSEVFSKSDFKKFAKENLVLVELDFPHGKRQTKKLAEQNAALKDKFKISGYPTLILVDAEGNLQARWGGYSKDFFAKLKENMGSLKK